MIETKNKLCPKCQKEMTDEEMVTNAQNCWLCLAEFLKTIEEPDKIPNPVEWGRPNGFEDLKNLEKQKKLQGMKPSSGSDSPLIKNPLELSEDQRKQMMINLGIDPAANFPVTVITIKGANDDTYLQFSCRGNINNDLKNSLERILRETLTSFGTIITFGGNFAGTLAQARLLGADLYLKS